MELLSFSGLFLLFLAAGHIMLCSVVGREAAGEKSVLETIVIDLIIGISTAILFTLILLYLGFFKVWLLITLLGVIALCALIVFRKRLALPRFDLKKDLLLAVVLAIALAVFLPPSEVVTAGRDEGMYPAIAAGIEEEGGYSHSGIIPSGLSDGESAVFIGISYGTEVIYPGFQITGRNPVEATPRFFPAFPAFLAVFMGVSSFSYSFIALSILGALALGAFFVAAEKAFSIWVGFAGSLLLIANVAVVYCAKLAFSEMLEMCIFFAALYFLSCCNKQKEGVNDKKVRAEATSGYIALSAGVLGVGAFVRPDGFILPLLFAWILLLRKAVWGDEGQFQLFTMVLAPFTVLWIYAALRFHSEYLLSLVKSFGSDKVIGVVAAAVLGTVIVILFRKKIKTAFSSKRVKGTALWLFAGLLGLLLIYGIWIRPMTAQDIGLNHAGLNMQLWALYLTLPGLFLAYAGYCYTLIRKRGMDILFFLTGGLAFSILLGYRMIIPLINVYLSRRLVPVVLPCAVMMISVACLELFPEAVSRFGERYLSNKGKVLKRIALLSGAAVIILLAVLFCLDSSPIWRYRANPGGAEALEELGEEIKELSTNRDPIVLLDEGAGGNLASPLRFIAGIDSLIIYNVEELSKNISNNLIKTIGAENRPVFLVTGEICSWDRKTESNIISAGGFKPVKKFSLELRFFQSPGLELPSRVVDFQKEFRLYQALVPRQSR